jgi:uncharacterized protein YeaO (DUF488 family)
VVRTKRVYDPPISSNGKRIRVDRLWPRGLRKKAVEMNEQLEDLSPSTQLRQWFAQHPDKKEEFKQRYLRELEAKTDLFDHLKREARARTVSLLFSADDLKPDAAIAPNIARLAYVERRRPRSSDRERPRRLGHHRLGRFPAARGRTADT